jgi:hypothetical protein
MRSKTFLVFLILFLFAIGKNSWGDEFYKWVDEKGTVHFSDNPTSVNVRKQDESQGKNQDRNKDKGQDKNQVKKQDKNQVKNQDGNLGKETTKEDALAILKGLEIGNRYIPEDMRKYGPAGPAVYERPQEAVAQSASPPSARRTVS